MRLDYKKVKTSCLKLKKKKTNNKLKHATDSTLKELHTVCVCFKPVVKPFLCCLRADASMSFIFMTRGSKSLLGFLAQTLLKQRLGVTQQ